MKNITLLNTVLLAILAVSISACASKKKGESNTNMDITLNITMTSSYCGGTPPSEDMLMKLKESKKYSSKSIHISSKNSLTEDMKEVKSDANGKAVIALDKGIYFVFLPKKVSAKHSGNDRSEDDCNKWKNTPNGTFTIGDDNSISFNIHETCDGCGALRM
jgi:hypothetical protein